MQVGESITRRSASNLAFAFIMLPREKRQSMCSLYAFCREVDDVADDDAVPIEERRQQLLSWRDDVRLAAFGGEPIFPVNQEMQVVIDRYALSFNLFDELLKGVESDLDKVRYETHEELEAYCYRVASVVGLLSIEVFGYKNARCRDYAVQLGLALQYTNILRDVWSDAERGRIYLPLEDLHRFNVGENEILAGKYSDRYRNLVQHVAARARAFYGKAADLLPREDCQNMVVAEMMGRVYWTLLRRLEASSFDVFCPCRVRVAKWHKVLLLFWTWVGSSAGLRLRAYGE
ncbi:MAG: All-trans-phytoene synthase [Verrucomicrobia subdivision 3 bacterium]|nr:All-trans-phytoene synthase [Limisphaerales bacterium]MCS1413468.1 All-trans-phytoene synthase [Limisphaerales bacterium]